MNWQDFLEGEPWGKNECWYFLQNGRIAAGITRPEKPLEDLRNDDLRILTPERGDLVCLQAGTVPFAWTGFESDRGSTG
jgi:mannose-6-phosphate isomerase